MGKLEETTYSGKKYHFRYYRKSKYHPFLVAIVTEESQEDGKIYLSGFNMTHSIEQVLKHPNKYIRISNPDPNDDSICFVYIEPIKNEPLKYFTRPIRKWDLSSEDILQIDRLVNKKLSE